MITNVLGIDCDLAETGEWAKQNPEFSKALFEYAEDCATAQRPSTAKERGAVDRAYFKTLGIPEQEYTHAALFLIFAVKTIKKEIVARRELLPKCGRPADSYGNGDVNSCTASEGGCGHMFGRSVTQGKGLLDDSTEEEDEDA